MKIKIDLEAQKQKRSNKKSGSTPTESSPETTFETRSWINEFSEVPKVESM